MLRPRRLSLAFIVVVAAAAACTLEAAELAYDGAGRVLTITAAGPLPRQIVGQILTTNGTPLSPATTYTSTPNGKGMACSRYGGGRFLVAYDNQYGPNDMDIEGFFIRPDGTVESQFH